MSFCRLQNTVKSLKSVFNVRENNFQNPESPNRNPQINPKILFFQTFLLNDKDLSEFRGTKIPKKNPPIRCLQTTKWSG